jgi:hypothetical protein
VTRLCACACINRLATVRRALPFLAEAPELAHLLVDLFETDESRHETHE